MKTNIIKIALKWLVIPTLLITTVLSANADWNSYGNPSPTPKPNCAAFHNAGYNGAVGGSGTNFASFNGYKDQRTEDGRPFDERQFTYIETQHADGNGLFPNQGTSDYTPWVNWSNYNFNTAQSTDYTFNFSNNANQKYYVGFWGYMHNNGAPDAWPAHGVNVELDGVNGPADNEFFPKYTINANNTCPLSVESGVRIAGNKDFTMELKEVYMFKEYPNNQANPYGWAYEIKDLSGNVGWKSSLLGEGGALNSNSGYNTARFDSSDDHYVLIYTEFELVREPEEDEPKFCRSVEIVSPAGANDGRQNNILTPPTIIITEALDAVPLIINSDYDSPLIEGYRYYADPNGRPGITFSETPNGPRTNDLVTTNTTVYLHGLPDNGAVNGSQALRITAINDINDPSSWELPCGDAVNYVYQPDDVEDPVCADLDTNPGSLGGQPVALNANTTITLDGPTNTDGDPFTINGQNPLIQYCYSNEDITFSPDIWQTSAQCAQAPSNVKLSVTPTTPGTMAITVLGTNVAACADEFVTEENQYGGVCLDLDFEEDIDFLGKDDYCVDLDLEPEVTGYNNEIEWSINNGEYTFTTSGSSTCIDENDFPTAYDWVPGDSLEATALIEGDCEDIIDSEEVPCTEFELDKSRFERGKDNEICVDDTDWPIQSTGVYVSIDGDNEFLVEVDEDDCFILDEDDLEDADEVEVWVPEWKNACNDDLDRVVYPPEFEKNVKDEDRSSASFSSRAAINFSDDLVDYQITYEHRNDEEQDVIILDTIGRVGFIQGYVANATSDISSSPKGGRIYYDEGSMRIYVEGEGEIEDCDDTNDDLCYNGDIGDRQGVEIENVPPRKEVRVTYSGEVDTIVSPSNCSDNDPNNVLTRDGVCGEIFPNTAEFEDEYGFDENDEDYDNEADVIIPCPFIIVRSGGEVFLENPFDHGVDTLSCSEIPNVPVPIITPDRPPTRTPSTGEGDSILTAFTDKSLCKDSDVEGYGDIKNISSLICEFTLKTSDDLTQYAIVQNLARNIQLFARYDKNLDNVQSINGSNELPASSNGVYVKKGTGNLKLGGEFADGAKTIVVIGGDIEITRNITFKDPTNLTDPRKIPSLALIVIGGDIVVAPGVTETNGIVFVQEGADGEGGKMCEGSCSNTSQYNENPLVHYGSIYGDIEHLFKFRTFAGDPTKDEAAILIRFDNRIYLNTPPILGELVNVSQDVF